MGNNDDTGGDKKPVSSGSSSVNGSKNKRKYLSEFLPDQLNMLSVTESPRYEVSEENSSNEVGLLPMPESDTGEQEIDGRTNPIVCELRALLSENLRRTFERAILKMVELGYNKDIAEQTLLKCGLYHGTKDTASNAVEGALIFMKKETSRCHTFQNFDQLVDYTLIEMESVLKEVKPDITDAEALWILLICDMNLLHACLVNENHPCNISLQDLFEEVSRGMFPSKQKPDTSEPTHAFSKNVHLSKSITLNSQTSNSEDLTIGTPTQWSNSKDLDIHEVATIGKKSSVSIRKSVGARKSCYLNISKGLPAEEKSAVCRKGPRGSSKREMLGQKLFHVEKCRPRGAFKATVPWSGMVSKPQKLPSSSSGIPMKSAFSEIWPRVRANSPLHKGNSNVPNVSLSAPGAADGPNTLGSEVSVFALPSLHAKDPLSLALESGPMSKTSSDSPGSSEERDSCTGMGSEGSVFALPPLHATAPLSLALEPGPMSNTSGDKPDSSEECDSFTEMSSDEKDENILILSSRLKALDEEIKYWNAWAIEKVKQATLRVSKDQEEIKMLKKEKTEAERLKNDKQGPEDSSQKRISEIKNATNNTTEQLAIINSTILSLDKGNSELRIKLEAAEKRASKATKNLKEAEVMQMDALKRSQAIDEEKIFLKEELTALKQQAADMRSQLERTEELKTQLEVVCKKEEREKKGYITEAEDIRRQTEQQKVESKKEEDCMRETAARKSQSRNQHIKKLKDEISELRSSLDQPKIAELRGGFDKVNYGGRKMASPESSEERGPKLMNKRRAALWKKNYGEEGSIKPERECILCMTEEMTVLFLPCRHQVFCEECNERHERESTNKCPFCSTTIEERIHVRFQDH